MQKVTSRRKNSQKDEPPGQRSHTKQSMTGSIPAIRILDPSESPAAAAAASKATSSAKSERSRQAEVGFADDTRLARALAEGHPGAPAALFDRYGPHVQRVLANIIGFDQELEDLLHEVFAVAFRSAGRLRDHERLKAWLTGIAVNSARAWIRGRVRWRRFFSRPFDDVACELTTAAPSIEINEAVHATFRVLEQLKPNQRIAFSLRYISGLQLTDVANACGVSLATIKRRLERADRRFRLLARREPALTSWLNDCEVSDD
jgi:RNA polymerase sigma-70 factor (ECF subfamily)